MSAKLISDRPPKFGFIGGHELNVEFELQASEIFKHRGGAFVTMDSSEQIGVSVSGDTQILGWAFTGEYTTPSTAGIIRLPVNIAVDALYLMLLATSDAAAARTEAQLKDLIGKTCDLDVISDVQYADYGATVTDVIQIVDYRYWGSAVGEQAVVVRMNPTKAFAASI